MFKTLKNNFSGAIDHITDVPDINRDEVLRRKKNQAQLVLYFSSLLNKTGSAENKVKSL